MKACRLCLATCTVCTCRKITIIFSLELTVIVFLRYRSFFFHLLYCIVLYCILFEICFTRIAQLLSANLGALLDDTKPNQEKDQNN